MPPQASPCKLQWGRARASAEIPTPRGWHRAAMGFNGAALVRARKFSREEDLLVKLVPASMGPRSCERGNRSQRQPAVADYKLQWGRARASAEIPSPQARTKEGAKLQWGRARASAEMRQSRLVGRLLARFNGAALVRARKYHLPQRAECQPPKASMGPRSCERGNALDGRIANRGASSFNGAALVRARKSEAHAQRVSCRCSFNGAALVRARKCAYHNRYG